jgi:encore-like protein
MYYLFVMQKIDIYFFSRRTQFKFPTMSSYQRMLVHRMAALYNMEHNVDPSGTQVVVARTQATKIPELRLRDQIRGELEPEPRRSILKRDTNSLEDTGFKVIIYCMDVRACYKF